MGGWIYTPWRDNFYPARWPQSRELEYASRALDTIEINSTWYKAQLPATYAKWREQTPDGFVFSLKAPRYITHRKRLAEAGKTVASFIGGGLAELGDRLGPINWQLPPGKAFDADDLSRFLDLLPRNLDGRRLRHAFEVRHPSFHCPEYIALARQQDVATVFTDSEQAPSFADLSSDFVYLRLKGSLAAIDTGYSADALDHWAARAHRWAQGSEPDDLPRVEPRILPQQQPRDVYVYFIGAAKERNPAAALSLRSRLQAS